METSIKYIIKRSDGQLVNIRFEPVKSIRAAARFDNAEEFQSFMTGYYAPSNPDDYRLQLIKITYEEVSE